jgi:SET domain-containing protein
MTLTAYCYLTPKAKARYIPEKNFKGLFAIEPIQAGEVLTAYMGKIIDGKTLASLPPMTQVHLLQIHDDLYVEPIQTEEAHFVNHSCEPNAWLEGPITVVARRDIEPGEEITFDYATCDGSPFDEFECLCGAPNCRKQIRGTDWKISELWKKYEGHFSPYLPIRFG